MTTTLFSPSTHYSVTEAYRYCEQVARTHYENFTVGSFLMDKAMLPHVFAVYAFCRWSDDLGDEVPNAQTALELLEDWELQLRRSIDGGARHPVFVALAQTIQKFQLPLEPFLDLIKAFKMDQTITRYPTFDDLLFYCRHSANPVGRIFLALFDYRDEERFQLSDATCTALQLANFWQDVPIDLEKGRIYVPLEDMRRYGYSPDQLIRKEYCQPFARLMQFEVYRTRTLFERGLALVGKVRGKLRLDVDLFSRGGLEILRMIEKIDYNVFSKRPALTRITKARLAFSAALRLWIGRPFARML